LARETYPSAWIETMLAGCLLSEWSARRC
jgi:hypothetical protein